MGVIDPREYKEELYNIQVAAFSAYPQKYRPSVDKEVFLSDIDDRSRYTVFGAFFKETGELKGYALLTIKDEAHMDFVVLKTVPEYEKYAINAALVNEMFLHYSDFLKVGGIICDGARSISHETNFQNFLEKYFEFRKAYCVLHVAYNPKIAPIVKLLFPFRGILRKFGQVGVIHKINGVLKMEEICRGISD